MKLITKSSLTFISASVIFFLIGSIVMYFSVRTIVSTNLNSVLIDKKKEIVLQSMSTELNNYQSKNLIIEKSNHVSNERFSDTVLIEDSKYVLYRKLDFYLDQNNKFYKVTILESQSRTDLLITKLVIMILGLAFLFFLILFFVNRHSIKSTLKVFYNTIKKIEKFDINTANNLKLDSATTFEIRKMNSVIQTMADSLKKDFESQKEYIENVSHEIQTPLSIINSKLDELIQSENLSKSQLEQIAILMESTNRLYKINQALIFLTKIDNRFYNEASNINLNKLLIQQLEFFDDIISQRRVKLKLNTNEELNIYMNKDLAESMISNLIRNAIVHNNSRNQIHISISKNSFMISNTGEDLTFPESKIFDRFKRSESNKRSLGIGLSVVRSICKLYSFNLSYTKDEFHRFVIKFK